MEPARRRAGRNDPRCASPRLEGEPSPLRLRSTYFGVSGAGASAGAVLVKPRRFRSGATSGSAPVKFRNSFSASLLLFDGNQLIKTYRIALGTNPAPPKEREGDGATPEGRYFVCHKNPQSQFHLSLAINYPNEAEAKRGLKDGLISRSEYTTILEAAANQKNKWNTLGGEVFVHGHGSSPDWTLGCIALDDSDIAELYRLVQVKTPITIYP